MKIVHNPDEMKNLCLTYRKAGSTIGLVPTMGALHAGHLSLLTAIQKQCNVSVMSIFVNPAQFGPNEDFAQYPRPFEADCALAEENGCDIVFAPKPKAMYPQHYATYIDVRNVAPRTFQRRYNGRAKVLQYYYAACSNLRSERRPAGDCA